MKFIIQVASPNFEESCQFYQDLLFHNLGDFDEGRYVYDGKCILLISKNRQWRNGLQIFMEDDLSKLNVSHVTSKIYDAKLSQDPNGFQLIFKSITDYPVLHTGQLGNALTGNSYGLGLETTQFKLSTSFWEHLGFEISFGDVDKGGFITLVCNGFGIGLFEHGSCPHSFNNPSLTYFNGKEGNPKIIEQIKEKGMHISEEITHFNDKGIVDNIIMKDPGGMGFFLFNDG